MALVACRECKEQISADAKRCPRCGAKQHSGRIALLVVGLLAIFIVRTVWVSGDGAPKGSQSVTANAAPSEDEKLKAHCIERREAVLSQAQEHLKQRRFGAAWADLNNCARVTKDPGLQKLADAARIADLRDTAENKTHPVSARLIALDVLQREFPQEFNAPTEKLQVALLRMRAAEEAAEKRREAAAKRRQGVRIGMTTADVLASSWGRPEKVNRSTYAWGTSEQWVYGSGNYLYFKDGVLESIQN